jgi:hypothetical protein
MCWRPIVQRRCTAAARVRDDDPVAYLRKFLLAGRNPDGGWGYYAGKKTRLEPTSWALIALGRNAGRLDMLRQWPTAGALLLERAGGAPNIGFHAVALLALHSLQIDHVAGIGPLIAAMERMKGVTLEPSMMQRQDNSLAAWSWIPNTFSWVEPTAWCLLALKKWARTEGIQIDKARCAVAERMLADRVCASGGWNYGNSNMLGAQLKAFVPTTAVALLAMQDLGEQEVVQRSRAYLRRAAASEVSGVALSLALMCLDAYKDPGSHVRAALEQQVPTTIALGNHLSAALSLCALEEGASAVLAI